MSAKVQVDVASLDGGTFKNFMLTLGSLQSSGGYAWPSVLNSDQYPTGTIGTSNIFGTFQIPSNLTSSTTLVLAWTGTVTGVGFGAMGISRGAPGFTVTVGSGFVVGGTSSNLNVQGTNGYIEFTINGTPPALISWAFQANSTFTGFSGLICCAKSDYASIIAATSAGQLISSGFVNALTALNPKSIRMMPWSDPDDASNFTQHKYRANWQTALTYAQTAWIPNCWAGTASGTNAYSASAATDTPGGYTLGEVLQLQFTNASTSTPLTINVGSRGILPLFDISGNALASIAANALATLIYDDLLAGYLVTFSGLTVHIPVETQIGLANAVGCPMWYSFPAHITNASVTQVATLIASTLNFGCSFEYANEVWNFAGGFEQTTFARLCGAALGFPSGSNRQYHGYYGIRIAQIMPLVRSAWGGKAGLKCVMGTMAFGTPGATGDVNVYRYKGGDLSTSLGYTIYNSYVGANYNTFPNRPIDVCDTIAYATYYSGAQCSNFDANYKNVGGTGLTTGGPATGAGSAISGLLGAADAFASGDTTNAIAWLDWDIRQGTNNGTAGSSTLLAFKSGASGTGIYPAHETLAQLYDGARPSGQSNLTIDCYEGSMESSAPSTSRCTALSISTAYGGAGGKIDNLLTAYKQSLTFYATVKQQFSDFFAAGVADGRSQTACWSFLTGASQWSLYVGDTYTAKWQSYDAVSAVNNSKRRFLVKT